MIVNDHQCESDPTPTRWPKAAPHQRPYHPKGGLIGMNINLNTCNNDMKGNVDENNTNTDLKRRETYN